MTDRRTQAASDEAQLQKLGYAQQLLRAMGGFSNFALSFSIISILTGGVTLYGHGLRFGGPLIMSLGWPLVTVFTLLVAASLAELASAFPTAGALYHWSAILGGRGWGFFTAWLNTIGQFAITAGIDYGMAELLVALLRIPTEKLAAAWGLPSPRFVTLGVFAAILVSHAVLNHVGVRVVAILNWLSAWYHMAGVALLVGALFIYADKQSPSFLLDTYTISNKGYLYGFLIGLLQAQWTFTGYDASAHVTEETIDPSNNAPRGIVWSVIVSGAFGWIMLIAITLAIDDLPAAAAAGVPFLHILERSLHGLGTALGWLAVLAMWFCGLSSVTSNSRMLFAFARDGGLPGARHVAKVSPTFRTPHVAVWLSAAAAFLVALWATAYSAMVALSTIALYASYALPIVAGVMARSSGKWKERGPWHLGRWSTAINVVAIVWVGIVTVLFVLPPNELAGYTFAGCLAVLAVYWLAYMRARFTGPKVKL